MNSQELLSRIRALIEQTQGVAFIVPEDTGYFSIDDDLVRQVRVLIGETVDLLRDITDFYDAESAAQGAKDESAADTGEFLREIGAQISSEMAARELSNLAFVARGQLQEIQNSLASALKNKEIWAVASHADSGLRRSGRALIAIETAICEYTGLETPDRKWVDLQDSLEIRRLYAQFRRAILRGGEPTGDQLPLRLKSAANRIAILRDLKIYPFLRIDDRKSIRQLQKRIISWLNKEGDSSDEAGIRLWQDLVSFARLLVHVNQREELREHDRQLFKALQRRLFGSGSASRKISASQAQDLERLLGRDDDLDEIIRRPDSHQVQDLRAPLERLQKELAPPMAKAQEGLPRFEA